MIRSSLFAAAMLLATPAFAQTASAPIAPPEREAGQSSIEAAFQPIAEAMSLRMQAMAQEMQAAIVASGSDLVKRDADLDAIEARYQPDVDAFISALLVIVEDEAAAQSTEDAAALRNGVADAMPLLQGMTGVVRTQVEQGTLPAPSA